MDTYSVGQLLSLSFYPWGQWARPVIDLLVALDVQSRFNEPNSHYVCMVALVGNRIVASLEISLRLIPIGRVPYLFNLAVHPQWRRRGIGSKLIAAGEAMISDWNFPYLYLHVLANNKAAQELYYRSGFECYQLEKRWLLPDRLLLRKNLEG